MVGTGYKTSDPLDIAKVYRLRPNGNTMMAPTNVTVNVYQTQEYNSNWSVTAYAICASEG